MANKLIQGQDMLAIAHRGASMLAPENTLAALRLAHSAGAAWVECDVQLTRDDVPVIIHDETLGRTTNLSGKLCDYTYKQIQECDAGSWFSERFSSERIPTLTQWLQLSAELGLSINLELKGNYRYQVCVEKVLQTIESYWPKDRELPLLSSFNRKLLRCLYQATSYHFALNVNSYWKLLPSFVASSRCVSVHLDDLQVSEKRVARLKKNNKKVYVFTVNELDRALLLKSWGVDGVFTDNHSLFNSL